MSEQVEVRLPELADAMASATVTAWLKKPGDPVAAGEPIAEVETDKTTVELEAPADGVLAEIRVEAGAEAVEVGALLALLRPGAPGASGAQDAPAEPSAAPGAAASEPPPSGVGVRNEGAPAPAVGAGDTVEGAPARSAVGGAAVPREDRGEEPSLHESSVGGAAGAAGEMVPASLPVPGVQRRDPPLHESAGGVAAGAAGEIVPASLPVPGVQRRDLPPGSSPIHADAVAAADTDAPATPLARRMAVLAGLDLSGVTGSGAGGRVMKIDVERLLRPSREPSPPPPAGLAPPAVPSPATPPAGLAPPAVPSPATPPAGPAPPAAPSPATPPAGPTPPVMHSPAAVPDLPHEDRPLTAMRRVTARRTAEAKRSAPHFYLEVECAVDRLLARRNAENAAAGGVPATAGRAGAPTVNDVVVRAAALALREVPLANSAWTGDAVRVYDRVDLAVAVTTPAGLVTPVVRAADTRTLAEIAGELRRLAADARAGRLPPADYQGGTCTISNLGMYGVASLYAILNPPQACILGVGAVTERPVVRDGAVAVGSTMKVTLSADHRAIDGATGAELLRALKGLLEDPQEVYG